MAIPLWFLAGSLALQVGGMALQAKAQKQTAKASTKQAQQEAKNEMIAAEYEARQAEYQGNLSKALSQKEAYEQRRVAVLLASKSLAQAAASGAGASDPDVVNILGNIYAEGAYRSALAMYEGEEQARSYAVVAQARRLGGKSAASAALTEGANTARASQMSMFSTLLSGGSAMLETYGRYKGW